MNRIFGRLKVGARRGVVTSSSTLNIPIPCSALSPDVHTNWRTLHVRNINLGGSRPQTEPRSSSFDNYYARKEYQKNLTFYVCLCQKLHNQYAIEIEDEKRRIAVENYAERCMDLVVVCATTGTYTLRQNTGAEISPLFDRAISGVHKDSDAAQTIYCISTLQCLLGAK